VIKIEYVLCTSYTAAMYKHAVYILFLMTLYPLALSANKRLPLSHGISEYVKKTPLKSSTEGEGLSFLDVAGSAKSQVARKGSSKGGAVKPAKGGSKGGDKKAKGGKKTKKGASKGGAKSGSKGGLLGAAAGLALGLAMGMPQTPQPPAKKCKPNGEGGKNCYPYEKYDMYTTLNRMKGCCKPCTEKFVRDLSLLQVSDHVKKHATQNFHVWKEAHNRRSDSIGTVLSFIQETQQANSRAKKMIPGAMAMASAASAGGSMESAAKNSMSGADIHNLLPCCDVCVEEFFAPSDFDDLSAFLDIKDGKQRGAASVDTFRFKATSKEAMDESTANKASKGGSKKKGGNKGGKGGGTVIAPAQDPASLANPLTSSYNFANSLKAGVPKTGHCCKICPADRYPSKGYKDFKPAAATFLETFESKGNDGCCPVCPSLFTLSSGGHEPFGGPFGEGTANMAQAMTESIQTMCSCYPNCDAHIVENHVGCREQDIRASLTSFIQQG
jgi:hypothetical protein